MEEEDLRGIIEEAARKLFENQSNLFEFTSQTGQTEWNLAHHLAVELHRLLPDRDCDLDVTKRNLGNRRPDIIFHKRGTNDYNFLVLELKFDGAPGELRSDIQKVADHWFGRPLKYQFGAVVDLRSDETCNVTMLRNE